MVYLQILCKYSMTASNIIKHLIALRKSFEQGLIKCIVAHTLPAIRIFQYIINKTFQQLFKVVIKQNYYCNTVYKLVLF